MLEIIRFFIGIFLALICNRSKRREKNESTVLLQIDNMTSMENSRNINRKRVIYSRGAALFLIFFHSLIVLRCEKDSKAAKDYEKI